MHIIFDKAATAKKCWPGMSFGVLEPVQRLPWLPPFFEETVAIGTSPVIWRDGPRSAFWNNCLVVERSPESQYDLLRKLDPDVSSAAGNVACLALAGEHFHGQKGRPWQTLEGNFHLSLKVDLNLSAATFSRPLVMLPAVVAMDVLAALGGPLPDVGIKWVNDILIARRKVAGVLTSARSVDGRLVSTVFGVGLNLAQAPASGTSPLFAGATSLSRHLDEMTPELGPLLEAFLSSFEMRLTELKLEGPSAVIEQYRRNSLVLDQDVAIWPEAIQDPSADQVPLHQGRVLDILPDLSLCLEGISAPIAEGRLSFLPEK